MKASVWTRMGKSQSKDEVKVEERKEERFVSTYCKAMRSLSSSSLHTPLNFDPFKSNNMKILSLFSIVNFRC